MHLAASLGVLLAGLWALPALADDGPRLHCRFEQSNRAERHVFAPTGDPYTVVPLAFDDNFRFKAVLVDGPHGLEYVKLYTYYFKRGQTILLHQASYTAPLPDGRSLTGEQRLYSPALGRELLYDCRLQGGAR